MNATHVSSENTEIHEFNVTVNKVVYGVKVWLNRKGKFIDDEISFPNGDELHTEGAEGEIREKILSYLDENWDKLVRS